MRALSVWWFVGAVACSGAKTDTAPSDSSADTSDTDPTTPTTPACAEVTDGGGWEWSGACIGMTMGCEITLDGCTFTISCPGMDMGLPESGRIDGDDVTFDDGNSLSGCTGTVDAPDSLTGTCDGGCTWNLAY